MPFISAAASIGGQFMANSANQSMNQATMDWETQMSDTAMQRRVADLGKAGLNPILAVGAGGASTPGFSPLSMGSLTGGVPGAMSAGAQANQMQSQIDNTKADTVKKLADANYTSGPQTIATGNQAGLFYQQANTQAKQTVLTALQTIAEKQSILANVPQATVSRINAEIDNLRSQTGKNVADMQATDISNDQVQKLFPLIYQDKALNNALTSAAVPAAQNQANFANTGIGRAMPYVNSAGDFLKLFPSLRFNFGGGQSYAPSGRPGPSYTYSSGGIGR